MSATDEELMLRFRQGEPMAFDELLARYKTPLYRTLWRLTADRALAEDLFQETWLRVIRHAGEFDPAQKFSAWLFRIGRNLATDAWRRRGARAETALAEDHPDPQPGPEHALLRREQAAAVSRAMQLLPPEQREVFVLRETGGRSFQEIAQITGAPLNTVLGRMHLAVGKLRAALAERAEA